MAKVYDVLKAMGTYTGQDGEERTAWLKCGMVVRTKNDKMALKLEALPLVDMSDGMWFSLQEPKPYQPKDKPQQQGFREQAQGAQDGFGDSMPDF
jgi:hypothetical protein